MTIKELVDAQIKDAMRAKDRVRVDTLRSILSQISYRRIESGVEPTAEEQMAVVRKLIKQHNDSIAEFQKAGRTELVAKEEAERAILQEFVPADMDAEAVRVIVRAALDAMEPAARTEGNAMKQLIPQFKDKVDGKVVRAILLEELAQPTT